MITLTCEICGNKFQVKPYRKNTARFCSFECGGKWHMRNRKMPHEHMKGNTLRKGIRPTNAFTSEQAKVLNAVIGNIYSCTNCGKRFEIKPWLERQNKSISGNRFCCKKCHSEFVSREKSGEKSPMWVGGITTYRGKGWLKARADAIKRDRGTCADCGKVVGKSIPVHHVRPFREFTSIAEANSIDNLICLCQSCHMKRENNCYESVTFQAN